MKPIKITQKAIDLIDNRDNRFEIAKVLDVSEVAVRRYINANEENGELTKKTVLLKIEELTGLTEVEILTESKAPETSKQTV